MSRATYTSKAEQRQRCFRWITVTAFLCASLVPPMGICFCSDCSCPQNLTTLFSATKSNKHQSGCCSQRLSVDSCCESADDMAKGKPESCPCEENLPKNAPTATESPEKCRCGCDQPTLAPALTTGTLRENPLDKIKPLIPYFSVDVKTLSLTHLGHAILNPGRSPTYQLPVRLHLLLLVLQN